MSQSYRFRYANEIAGGFVLLALSLLIIGIYAAGHAQGWFEKNLVLKTKFDVDKGTYGLQEGAEVRILSTLAGRVGGIKTSEEGGIETTLILQGKFGKFVRADSIAKVSKKYEVAGDAFVNITLGSPGQPVLQSGDYIKCVQDVELIETAKRIIDDLRKAAMPMLDEVSGILSNVNSVTRQIERREGVAGRLIGDPEWARDVDGVVKDVRQTAAHLPLIAMKIDGVVTNIQELSMSLKATASGFPKISDGAAGVVQDVRNVTGGLTGQIANIQAVLLQTESLFRETQVFVEGLQKSWLFGSDRKVSGLTPMNAPLPESSTPDSRITLFAAGANAAYQRGDIERAEALYSKALQQARLSDDRVEISRNAYNLALCRMAQGNLEEANGLLEQAGALAGVKGQAASQILLAKAELARLCGNTGASHLRRADWLRKAGQFKGMVAALDTAAQQFGQEGNWAAEFDCRIRMAQSLLADGNREAALLAAKQASELAERGGQASQKALVAGLMKELK